MSTPFDSLPTTPAAELATHGQLTKAIEPMLRDRAWNNAAEGAAYVRRLAAINTVLATARRAATDDRLVEQLDIALFDRHDVTGTFHQMMSFMADHAAHDERMQDVATYKPLTREGASKLIDWLGSQQFAGARSHVEEANIAAAKASTAADEPQPVVPAGRYAVATEDGATNELAFYKVDHGKAGTRWEGFVFLSHIVGGHDDMAVRGAAKHTILAKIAADPEAASAAYGHHIGRCGICHTTLTNDESRARGIGPKCASKQGW